MSDKMLVLYSGVGTLLSAVTATAAAVVSVELSTAARLLFAAWSFPDRFLFLPTAALPSTSAPAVEVEFGVVAAVVAAVLRLQRSGVSLLRGNASAVMVGIRRSEKPERHPAAEPSLISSAGFLQDIMKAVSIVGMCMIMLTTMIKACVFRYV